MITYSAPASRTIAALTSPVSAPSRSQWQVCPATAMLLLRAASATACSAVNGGATTISTPVTDFTTERSSFTCTTASCTVLNIFQLPAMSGCRMGVSGPGTRCAGRGELAGHSGSGSGHHTQPAPGDRSDCVRAPFRVSSLAASR